MTAQGRSREGRPPKQPSKFLADVDRETRSMADAACAQEYTFDGEKVNPDWWFAVDADLEAGRYSYYPAEDRAKQICAECPVRDLCATLAEKTRVAMPAEAPMQGIWAGITYINGVRRR